MNIQAISTGLATSLTIGLVALGAAPAAAQTLVARYSLDETSGPAFDASGAGLDGSWLGGVMQGVPGAVTGTGLAAHLDGVDARAQIANNTVLDPLTSDFTVLAWVNLDATGQWMRIFGGDPGWGFGFFADRLLFTTYGVQDYTGPVAATVGSWQHVALTFDATFLATFYVDGVAVGSVPGAAPSLMPGPNWWLGTKQGNTEFFQGAIDEVQVYAGALGAAQVLELFQNPGRTLGIGTNYCGPASSNSTGQAARIAASGGTYPGGLVRFEASFLPAGKFGFFLMSPTQSFLPGYGGSQGILCLDPAFGGFRAPGQIQLSDAAGTMALEVDTTSMPMATPVMVAPGQTWNFQAWFRDDNPGRTSNFTDGIEIAFS